MTKVIKPTAETPVPEGMKFLSYDVLEEVSYTRAMFVPVDADEDQIYELVERDWKENGDPLKDCVAVNEMDFEFEMDKDDGEE